MRSDGDIKRDVEDELRWDPDIDATDIAVAVKDGVVTLTGFVRSYSQKRQAEADAKRVAGVLGLANDIEVRLPVVSRRPESQIARDAVATIQMELPYSYEHIKVVVNEGWVTLEGEVEWHYQRERAEDAVQRLTGVKGISNLIRIKPKIVPPASSTRSRKHSAGAPRSTRTASRSRRTAARLPSKAPCDPGPNVKRPNEPPGRRRASRRWTTGSPSARKTVAGGRVDGGGRTAPVAPPPQSLEVVVVKACLVTTVTRPLPSGPARISWARLLTTAGRGFERRPEGRKPERTFVKGVRESTSSSVPVRWRVGRVRRQPGTDRTMGRSLPVLSPSSSSCRVLGFAEGPASAAKHRHRRVRKPIPRHLPPRHRNRSYRGNPVLVSSYSIPAAGDHRLRLSAEPVRSALQRMPTSTAAISPRSGTT